MAKIYLVQVKYRGSSNEREYSYYDFREYNKDDVVVVPIGKHEKHAIVTKCFEIKRVLRDWE